MKRKLKIGIGAALAFTAFACYYKYCNSNKEQNELILENVEAISNTESGGDSYNVLHFPCYRNVNYVGNQVTIETGQYSATCYKRPYGNRFYHQHSCSNCKDF